MNIFKALIGSTLLFCYSIQSNRTNFTNSVPLNLKPFSQTAKSSPLQSKSHTNFRDHVKEYLQGTGSSDTIIITQLENIKSVIPDLHKDNQHLKHVLICNQISNVNETIKCNYGANENADKKTSGIAYIAIKDFFDIMIFYQLVEILDFFFVQTRFNETSIHIDVNSLLVELYNKLNIADGILKTGKKMVTAQQFRNKYATDYININSSYCNQNCTYLLGISDSNSYLYVISNNNSYLNVDMLLNNFNTICIPNEANENIILSSNDIVYYKDIIDIVSRQLKPILYSQLFNHTKLFSNSKEFSNNTNTYLSEEQKKLLHASSNTTFADSARQQKTITKNLDNICIDEKTNKNEEQKQQNDNQIINMNNTPIFFNNIFISGNIELNRIINEALIDVNEYKNNSLQLLPITSDQYSTSTSFVDLIWNVSLLNTFVLADNSYIGEINELLKKSSVKCLLPSTTFPATFAAPSRKIISAFLDILYLSNNPYIIDKCVDSINLNLPQKEATIFLFLAVHLLNNNYASIIDKICLNLNASKSDVCINKKNQRKNYSNHKNQQINECPECSILCNKIFAVTKYTEELELDLIKSFSTSLTKYLLNSLKKPHINLQNIDTTIQALLMFLSSNNYDNIIESVDEYKSYINSNYSYSQLNQLVEEIPYAFKKLIGKHIMNDTKLSFYVQFHNNSKNIKEKKVLKLIIADKLFRNTSISALTECKFNQLEYLLHSATANPVETQDGIKEFKVLFGKALVQSLTVPAEEAIKLYNNYIKFITIEFKNKVELCTTEGECIFI